MYMCSDCRSLFMADTLRLCLFSQEARRLVSRVIAFGENGNKNIDVIGIDLSYLRLCVL